MTALLEFKQKIKGIYAQYEMYLLPLLKICPCTGLFHLDQYQHGIYDCTG